MSNQLFDYEYVDNNASKTLFLLHGTGGTKNDFFFLNDLLDKKYNLLGLQGNVDEHGMARFFKRISLGQFDQESIQKESGKLIQFIEDWQVTHNLISENTCFLGYSNGANILLAALTYAPSLFKNLILLHPMLPFSFENKPLDLSKNNIYVTTGIKDPIVSDAQSSEVIESLRKYNAQLIHTQYPHGHQISDEEIHNIVKLLAI